MSAASRPKRSSAKATADKINASLKAEGAKIDEPPQTEPPPPRSAGSRAGLHNAKQRAVVPKAEAIPKATKGATSGKAGKRPVATISLLDDDADDHGVGTAVSAGKRPAGSNNLAAPKAKRAAPSKAAGGGGAGARGAGVDSAAQAEGDVLLGHFVSRCVGIQHYRNNGVRYSKEPLQPQPYPYPYPYPYP